MYASSALQWYLLGTFWFHAMCGWYSVDGTTLRNHRDVVGDGGEAVPVHRYYQERTGDKEVVHGTMVVNSSTYPRSGADDMVIRDSSTQRNDSNNDGLGIKELVPRNTTANLYQDRSTTKEVVSSATPVALPDQVDESSTTSRNRQRKGERDVVQKKSETNNDEGGSPFKRQNVINGSTFGYRSNHTLDVTGEMLNTSSDHLPSKTSTSTDSEEVVLAGRGMKMPKPNSQTMQYLLVPGFILSGLLPWVMPKLQMIAMALSMVNNMAFTSALFTLIRNFIFERESAQNVLYINNGYKKRNRHRNKGHLEHAPIQYDHHGPGSDHYEPPGSYEYQEYAHRPSGLDHQEYPSNHREYQQFQDHSPIPLGWESQGPPDKFSEKWRRSNIS
ncbi:unnamed protein product [Acanthoscelides obtectus]|uniref:Uncharacterized protein n=1 Tax=Acanthoscelides obtectus TaxID=200917 RepID=A0A9P0L963_ACAOB|nr:unnamed protein product [Acanthoscelides obtectus]CAK1664562.1 hypothetical protein AOBTE_LOCUS24333 [Acanthoscelides obtectus]